MVNFTGFTAALSEHDALPVYFNFPIYWVVQSSWSRKWGENWGGSYNPFSGWGANYGTDFGKAKKGYFRGALPAIPSKYIEDPFEIKYGSYTFHIVNQREFEFDGYVASSYFNVFYNRILIEPTFVDFGNILSEQSMKIVVFNAFLNDVTIQSIDLQDFDEGTTYTSIPTPYTFPLLEEQTTYVTATVAGDPQIDAKIAYSFGGGLPSITVSIVGSRIVLFPVFFEDTVEEELIWATEILNSYNGTEQRIRIRKAPRQRLKIRAFLNYVDKNRLDNLIWGWRKRVWAIPMWIEARQAGIINQGDTAVNIDTRYADFRLDGLAVIFESADKFDVFQISGITDNSLIPNREISKDFKNPIVMPVQSARMVSDPIRRTSGSTAEVLANFEVLDNIVLETSPTAIQHNGLDVFFEEHNAPSGGVTVEDSYEHRADVVDFIAGKVLTISPWTYTRVNRTFELVFEGPEEVWNLRKWLHRRSGRLVPFYGSNSEDAFYIISAGTIIDSIIAKNNDYSNQAAARNRIAIYQADGNVSIHTIVESTVGVGGDTISIRFTPEVGISRDQIVSIQTVTEKRLSSDNITLKWRADHKVFVEIPTTEIRP